MIMTFKNVGIVGFAEIELAGLTVFTGLNDTGKSFLSKSIYSIIKTIKDSSVQEINEKASQLDGHWIRIRDLLNVLKQQQPELSTFFDKVIMPLRSEVQADISNKVPPQNTINKIRHRQLELLKNEGVQGGALLGINDQFKTIMSLVGAEKRESDIRMGYFNQTIIQQLFRSQINNLLSPESPLVFSWREGGNEVLKIVVENNKTEEFTVDSSFFSLLHFIDATIIDSPIILQLNSLILKYRLDVTRPQFFIMPIYYADLISKIIPVSNPVNPEINNIIKEIIGGTVIYEIKSNKILFLKDNGQVIEGYNIANGIKSFGAIQLLLNAGSIHKNSILIIDEPEVHLHPKWIIEYAKIIIELARVGIPLVVSSHSPYLLEALVQYCEPIQDKTKFYWGEHLPDGASQFKDVTTNPKPIFKALADPMKSLM